MEQQVNSLPAMLASHVGVLVQVLAASLTIQLHYNMPGKPDNVG